MLSFFLGPRSVAQTGGSAHVITRQINDPAMKQTHVYPRLNANFDFFNIVIQYQNDCQARTEGRH
jgi:hypothetical protein